MIDEDKTAIMEWNKSINDEIGEATKKHCASMDKSSEISSRVTGNYVYDYKGVDRLRKSKKRRVLRANRY